MEVTVQDVTDSNHFIWYSNLKTKTSLEVLNNLLESAQKNEQIFFHIYDEDEMVKDPSINVTIRMHTFGNLKMYKIDSAVIMILR